MAYMDASVRKARFKRDMDRAYADWDRMGQDLEHDKQVALKDWRRMGRDENDAANEAEAAKMEQLRLTDPDLHKEVAHDWVMDNFGQTMSADDLIEELNSSIEDAENLNGRSDTMATLEDAIVACLLYTSPSPRDS